MNKTVRVLAVGDVVSAVGCEKLRELLPSLKKEKNIDVCIVNGENAAVGNGMTAFSCEHIFASGADATPGGWGMDSASPFTRDANDKYVFTWEGELVPGEMKACLVKDGTYSCPFLRPSVANTEISSAGVAAPDFVFYAGDPDNKWKVTEAGTYRITFNLKDYTIAVEKK